MSNLVTLRQRKGWSQRTLFARLDEQARREGSRIASWASMKTRISKWENGHVVPDEFYRGLLARVFAVDEEALGFTESSSTILGAAPPVTPALAVTPEVVSLLEAMFTNYVQADRLLGPRAIIGAVREQCRMIESVTASAKEPVRTDLLRIGARFFEFGGWLAQDSGDFDAASMWSTKALDMAYEVGDRWFTAYVFMRRSNIATESGNRADGLGLARAALRDSKHLGPLLHALSLRQQANSLALAGDERGCAESIERALESAESNDASEPLASYCTTPYLLMEGAAAWSKLGRPDRAVGLLTDALDDWPEGDKRDRGVGLARLANAHVMAGSIESACERAHSSIEIVRTAPSARALAELSRLNSRLSPFRRNRDVVELTEAIRSLS